MTPFLVIFTLTPFPSFFNRRDDIAVGLVGAGGDETAAGGGGAGDR